MHSTIPDARNSTSRPQGSYKPMPTNRAFEWVRCPNHPWLGVSTLVVGDHAACYLPDGSSHSVQLEHGA